MDEQSYIASTEKDDIEFSRLRIVEQLCDSATTRRLSMTGVSEGWKCLEVGAGAGSVAKWLSKRVGAKGKVVATDIDIRFLSPIRLPNLEVRQHDMLKDDLETGFFDLAHCRVVLMHLSQPESAIRRMANSLRPGGWIVVEEMDYGVVLSADATDPRAVAFSSTFQALFDFLRKRAILDPYFGRRVRRLIEQLGFDSVENEGWSRVVQGGDLHSRQSSMTLQMAVKPMIAAGLLTQEKHDEIQSLLADPSFSFPSGTMFCAWGRRPLYKH